MAVLICCDCGHIFAEDDAGVYRECVGEFWGAPAWEEFVACPACGGIDLDDAEEEEDESDESL